MGARLARRRVGFVDDDELREAVEQSTDVTKIRHVGGLDHLAERRDVALTWRDAVDVQLPAVEVDGVEQHLDLGGLERNAACSAHLQKRVELAQRAFFGVIEHLKVVCEVGVVVPAQVTRGANVEIVSLHVR